MLLPCWVRLEEKCHPRFPSCAVYIGSGHDVLSLLLKAVRNWWVDPGEDWLKFRGMVALAGLWHDRSRASAGYVVSVCQDAFPSEARILWNGGAQCGGQSHWHRDWHVIALQSAWRNLHPRTPNYERWICGHDHTLPLNFSICYTKL